MEKRRNKCLCISDECEEVKELQPTGITIYKFKIHVGTVSPNPTKTVVEITPGPEDDIYLVMNTSGLPDLSKYSDHGKLATDEIPCKRCLYIQKYAQRHLEQEKNIQQNDIVGICNHCKASKKALDMRALCTQAIAKHFFKNLKQNKEKQKSKDTKGIDDIPSEATIPWTYFRESRTMLHKGFKPPPPFPGDIEAKKHITQRYFSDEFITHIPFLTSEQQYGVNHYFYPKCISEAEKIEYIPGTRIKTTPRDVPVTISDVVIEERKEDEPSRSKAKKLEGFSILHHRFKNEVRRKEMREQGDKIQVRPKGFHFHIGQDGDEHRIQTYKERRERQKMFYDKTYDPERPMYPIPRRRYRTRSFEKFPFRKLIEVPRRPSDLIVWKKDKQKYIKEELMPQKEPESEIEIKTLEKSKSRLKSRSRSRTRQRSRSLSMTRRRSASRNEEKTPESSAISDVTTTTAKSEVQKPKPEKQKTEAEKQTKEKVEEEEPVERKLPPPPPPPVIMKKSSKNLHEPVKESKSVSTHNLIQPKSVSQYRMSKKSLVAILPPALKKLKEEREKMIAAESKPLLRSESDLITKALKGKLKLRDLPRPPKLEHKSEQANLSKRSKQFKSQIPKLKPREGELEKREVEVKVVDVSTDTKDLIPRRSLLQEHLKHMKKAQKAGQRDPQAVAKAEKELEMNQIKMQSEEKKLNYLVPKHKVAPVELPPLPKRSIIFTISALSPRIKKERGLDSGEAEIDSDEELDKESLLNKGKVTIPPQIIKNTGIRRFNKNQYIKEAKEVEPKFYKIPFTRFPSIDLSVKSSSSEDIVQKKPSVRMMDAKNKNILRYSLSNHTFIDKGWTKLPTEKVLRKMNVYPMRPTHPEYDFFKRNYKKGSLQYDTGETLAQFKNDNDAVIYYRNGKVALKYYTAKEPNAGQRYVVYSSGNPDNRGNPRPVTVLAMFDHSGSGIVFDHEGKTRLKYNQTEGVVLDPNMISTKWNWHTLNDPPVLQKVMIENQLPHKDPQILKLGKSVENHRESGYCYDKTVIETEFHNFVKERLKKQSLDFKPFQIKMKAIKINDEFSLKILDQKTIFLNFQEGSTHITFNLGLVLDNTNIIDTETSELGVVGNSLEKFPAKTDSIEDLQKILLETQNKRHKKVDKENRVYLRIPRTVESADKMEAALSRPLRTIGKVPTLQIRPSAQTNTSYCMF